MEGDRRSAFLEDVSRHQGLIHKICRLYFHEPAEREDAFQDILLNAWRSYPSFAGRSAFSTWLYRVALNTALMRLRAARPERRNMAPGAAEKAEKVAVPAGETAGDDIRALRRAVESLDDLEKSVILLHLEDLGYREIAEITGLTENHVGVKLNRIKAKLRERLSAPEIEHGR